VKIPNRTTYHGLVQRNHTAFTRTYPFRRTSRFPFHRDEEELSPREEIGSSCGTRIQPRTFANRALTVRQRGPRQYDWISSTDSASRTANTLDRRYLAGGSARVTDKDGAPVARARKIQIYRVVQLENEWFRDEKTHRK